MAEPCSEFSNGRVNMSNLQTQNKALGHVEFIRISDEERVREAALRNYFADFWGSASGEPRPIYDTFISATPLTDGVTLEAVDEADVHGWWVRAENGKPRAAILYIHGGGYVQGSAKAYRGFVSQIVSRTQVSAFVLDYPLAPEASLPRPQMQRWPLGTGSSGRGSNRSPSSAIPPAAA